MAKNEENDNIIYIILPLFEKGEDDERPLRLADITTKAS